MIFALLTALFWTGGSYSGSRVARVTDGPMANGMRLLLSLMLWGGVVAIVPSISWPTFKGAGLFLLAGFLHQALGDNALYTSYQKIGPRIGILFCMVSSVLGALFLEKLLIGGWPSLGQLLGMVTILLGAVLALAPKERFNLGKEAMKVGVPVAILAGLLQATGAVTARGAYLFADLPSGLEASLTPTFYRVLGSVVGLALIGCFPLGSWLKRLKRTQGLGFLIVFSTLMGPCFGVFCYQAALHRMNSGVVQSVICTLPLLMVPVTWALDGDRPSGRSVIGVIVAIGGMALLLLE